MLGACFLVSGHFCLGRWRGCLLVRRTPHEYFLVAGKNFSSYRDYTQIFCFFHQTELAVGVVKVKP